MAFIYRIHAVERMFQRDISEAEIETVVLNGEVIEEYLDDKPYPSFLVFGEIRKRIIHVVYAKNEDNDYVIITVYQPDLLKWKNDYRTRR